VGGGVGGDGRDFLWVHRRHREQGRELPDVDMPDVLRDSVHVDNMGMPVYE
jgi:hypothetical protein